MVGTDIICAQRILEVVPKVMRTITADVRHHQLSVPLTMPQFRTLRLLGDRDCRASDLARQMVVARPTMTSILDGLAAKGLVQRTVDPLDRRQSPVRITDRGRLLLREFEEKAQERLAAAVAFLSEEERESLTRSLERLEAAVCPPTTPLGPEAQPQR